MSEFQKFKNVVGAAAAYRLRPQVVFSDDYDDYSGRHIFIFAGPRDHSFFIPSENVRILSTDIELSNYERNIKLPKELDGARFYTIGEYCFAAVVEGKVYFCDFIHNEDPIYAPFFFSVLEQEGFVERGFFDKAVMSEVGRVIRRYANAPFYKIKYIELVDDKREMVNKLKSSANNIRKILSEHYAKQSEIMRKTFDARFEKLKEKGEREKTMLLVEAIRNKSLLADFEISEKGNEIILRKRIKAECYKKRDTVYELPSDMLGKFYVENIRIKIEPVIYNRHVNAEKAYHPNVSSSGSCCIGDLEGKSLFEVIKGLEGIFKMCNLDSAFSNHATNELTKAHDELVEEETIEDYKICRRWSV